MSKPSIFIISGGIGTSGSQLVRTALAQFLINDISVSVVPNVQSVEQLEVVIRQAASEAGIIVHTLVDEVLRLELIRLVQAHSMIEIDLMGPLLVELTKCLGQKPVGKPGLYRKMREQDLRRIEAIEFAVDHDDGKRADELHQADIVLTGVSRVGKTPLSMYLSTMGWKVANVPIVPTLSLPPLLFEIDSRRVVGLTIEPGQLVMYRRRRGRHLGITDNSSYTAPLELLEELDFAAEVFRRGGFRTIDVTDKPIEESAEEIIARISAWIPLSDKR